MLTFIGKRLVAGVVALVVVAYQVAAELGEPAA